MTAKCPGIFGYVICPLEKDTKAPRVAIWCFCRGMGTVFCEYRAPLGDMELFFIILCPRTPPPPADPKLTIPHLCKAHEDESTETCQEHGATQGVVRSTSIHAIETPKFISQHFGAQAWNFPSERERGEGEEGRRRRTLRLRCSYPTSQ